MAKEVLIKSWCDVCLDDTDDGEREPTRTEAETFDIPAMLGHPAFVVELCEKHAAPFVNRLESLAAVGREPEKPARRRSNAPSQDWRNRPDNQPGDFTCPKCGHNVHTIAALRTHVRREHDTSLAGVGYGEANEKCDVCGDPFPNKQGLAAHVRTTHADVKQPA